jgi:uncharacterized membrane protein
MLTDILTFFGRMHPLVVHLPIGFLLLAMIFDGISYFKKYEYLQRAVPFALLIGFVAAGAACLLGYMLSLTGDYDPATLNNHRISGISLALAAGILYATTTPSVRKIVTVPRPLFSVLSVATFILLSYAGHQGATLTHGDGYITLETLLHEEREKPSRPEEAMIFEDIVHPILERRCMKCHQRTKKKGQLSLESLATMLKGGKHGPSVVPGDPGESELFRRVTLDPSDEDFMPKEGKTPLTKTETEVIRWWIEKAFAVDGKKISELNNHEEIGFFVASLLGPEGEAPAEGLPVPGQKVNKDIPDTLDMKLVENLRKKGLMVRVMLQKPVMLDITLPPRSAKRMEDLVDDLDPVVRNIVWLNLSDNGFSESDLSILQRMSNVEKLRLEKNPIANGISNYLGGLKHLEVVNLNETNINMVCLKSLQRNPAIKRIYTWHSRCDSVN